MVQFSLNVVRHECVCKLTDLFVERIVVQINGGVFWVSDDVEHPCFLYCFANQGISENKDQI